MRKKSIFEHKTGAPTVAIFVPSMAGGGAERVMVALANGIASRGYGVDLVLASAQGPHLDHVSAEVRIVDLQCGRVSKSLLALRRYLLDRKPVAMISAMNHANVIAVFARLCARTKTRLVVSERNTISVDGRQSRSLSHSLVWRLVPWAYRRADEIVAVSDDVARDLENFAGFARGSVHTIYNPVDLTTIASLATQPTHHPWLDNPQKPVVLGIGRLSPQKDFSLLIRAFAKVRKEHDVRLLILGEGELREELTDLAKANGLTDDDFQMPGFVRNPFAYLAKASLFVLSSQWEGLPNAPIEAMACGTPVVSTNCPSGPREILEEGRWGALVPVGDVDALAKAMSETLSMPREQLPAVEKRARDFEESLAIDAYLKALALPPSYVE